MKYLAHTHDGGEYQFSSEHKEAVEHAMKTRQPIRLEGMMVAGSSISRISKVFEQNSGNDLFSSGIDIFQLAAGSPNSFWRQVFVTNGKRKIWIHNPLIRYARTQVGDDVVEIFAFIDAEWEKLKEKNVLDPKEKDYQLERMTKDFYKTDAGREYHQKVRYFN